MDLYLITYLDGRKEQEQVLGLLTVTDTHYDFFDNGLVLSVARKDVLRVERVPVQVLAVEEES